MLMSQGSRWVVISTLLSMMLAACGGSSPESKLHSKPAVKINGQTIQDVELQIKAGMQSGNGGIKLQPVSAQIMESAVGSELMRQAALNAQLDKDPIISARIADSTRRILALAYVDQLIRDIKPPTNPEIDAYYNAHPDLFAQRIQYELRECLITLPQSEKARIQDTLKQHGQFEAFEKWLSDNKIVYQSSPLALSSDQLPDDLTEKIKTVQLGGHLLLEGKNSGEIRIVFLISQYKSALSLAASKLNIIKTINDQRRKDALGEAKKSLRDKAKIEYIQPYTENGFVPEIKAD